MLLNTLNMYSSWGSSSQLECLNYSVYFYFKSTVVDYTKYVAEISASDSSGLRLSLLVSPRYNCSPDYRQISVISADGDNARCRSVKRHACSQRKHADMQEKKQMEKLIQGETTETGRVSV